MIDFDLFLKYFAGKADPEEAISVEEWAAASEENQSFFESLHQSWLSAGDELYTHPDVQSEWNAFHDRHIGGSSRPLQPRPLRRWITRVAAAACIAATGFAGYYAFNTKNQNQPTEIVEAGDKAVETRLADGTKALIRPGSELVYPVPFKKDVREATLVGSASFDISHNPAQPFLLHLGDLHIQVLGTRFTVDRDKKQVSVKVTTGKVKFYNKKDQLIIAAGETGRYLKKEKKFVLEPATPLTGSFHFNNTPLQEVVATLSSHFGKEIVLRNPGQNSCRLSAGFEHQGLEDILQEICATFNLTMTIEDSRTYINGQGCR